MIKQFLEAVLADQGAPSIEDKDGRQELDGHHLRQLVRLVEADPGELPELVPEVGNCFIQPDCKQLEDSWMGFLYFLYYFLEGGR